MCVCVRVSLSLSLSHTHTHTLSLSLSPHAVGESTQQLKTNLLVTVEKIRIAVRGKYTPGTVSKELNTHLVDFTFPPSLPPSLSPSLPRSKNYYS